MEMTDSKIARQSSWVGIDVASARPAEDSANQRLPTPLNCQRLPTPLNCPMRMQLTMEEFYEMTVPVSRSFPSRNLRAALRRLQMELKLITFIPGPRGAQIHIPMLRYDLEQIILRRATRLEDNL